VYPSYQSSSLSVLDVNPESPAVAKHISFVGALLSTIAEFTFAGVPFALAFIRKVYQVD